MAIAPQVAACTTAEESAGTAADWSVLSCTIEDGATSSAAAVTKNSTPTVSSGAAATTAATANAGATAIAG